VILQISTASFPRSTASCGGSLRRLAAAALRRESRGHTLQPTALVNEAYLRLARSSGLQIVDRRQFLAIAARVMRQVLVEHARARQRIKRGGSPLRVTLGDDLAAAAPPVVDLLALDQALERLARLSDQQVRIIELRYLAGLSVEEVAEVLAVSPTTVKRDTAMARAWLMTPRAARSERPSPTGPPRFGPTTWKATRSAGPIVPARPPASSTMPSTGWSRRSIPTERAHPRSTTRPAE